MRFFGLLALASAAVAAPLVNRAYNNTDINKIDDMNILQFALTLELLEINLYKLGYNMFSSSDFQNAGFNISVDERFSEIIFQESMHIKVISEAIENLGGTPNQPCQYQFNFTGLTGPKGWLTLTSQVDGLGPNAYLGAGPFITNKKLLGQATSILSTESRHNTWVRTLIGEDPFAQAFEQPLTFSQALTVASPFIVECPSSNTPLLATVFPGLNVTTTAPYKGGQTVSYKTPAELPDSYYGVFQNNDSSVFVKPSGDNTIKLPNEDFIKGQVYFSLSSSSYNLTDANTLAGPTPIEIAQPPRRFSFSDQSSDSS